jgi:hypothetical protein
LALLWLQLDLVDEQPLGEADEPHGDGEAEDDRRHEAGDRDGDGRHHFVACALQDVPLRKAFEDD